MATWWTSWFLFKYWSPSTDRRNKFALAYIPWFVIHLRWSARLDPYKSPNHSPVYFTALAPNAWTALLFSWMIHGYCIHLIWHVKPHHNAERPVPADVQYWSASITKEPCWKFSAPMLPMANACKTTHNIGLTNETKLHAYKVLCIKVGMYIFAVWYMRWGKQELAQALLIFPLPIGLIGSSYKYGIQFLDLLCHQRWR